MEITTVSLIISACVDISLCVAAVMKNFRSRLFVAFATLSGLLFMHDALGVVEGIALEVNRSRSLLAVGLGPAILWLLSEIIVPFRAKAVRISFVYVLVGVGMLLIFWIGRPLGIASGMAHALLVIPSVIWLFVLATRVRDSAVIREKNRFRQLFWGGIIVVVSYSTFLFEVIGLSIPALGHLVRTFYLLFFFQVFIQKELMTIEEIVAKVALFGGVALILAVFYSLLVSWVGDRPGLFFFNTLIASFGIIVLFDPIRNFTSKLTRKLFLERHNMLERELSLLSSDLMGIVDLGELSLRIERALKKSLGITSTSLFLAQTDGLSFAPIPEKSFEIATSDPLIEYIMLRRGRPFLLENVENDREAFHSPQPKKFCDAVLSSMRNFGFDFVVAFMHDSRLVGFSASAMGERILLTNEQLRLILPLARQVAVILKNAQVFQYAANREKLAAVGELAAGLAHEIKNPLGAIRGAAELLQESKVVAQDMLKIILDETDRLSSVVTSVLDFAKPRRTSASSTCDALKVIEHTAKLFSQEGKRIEIDAESVPPLPVDPESLKQVLVNLCLNAVQATEKKDARICIRVRAIHPFSFLGGKLPMATLGWLPEPQARRSCVEIEVADNGPGIPAVELPRIFVPFHTTKPSGTGLGLAICNRLIDGMGGTIQCHSKVNEGTRFTIHLPIVDSESMVQA